VYKLNHGGRSFSDVRLFYKIDANSSQWIVNVGAKLRGKTFSDRNPKKTP